MTIPRFVRRRPFLGSSRKPSRSLLYSPCLHALPLFVYLGTPKHVSCVTNGVPKKASCGFERVATMISEHTRFFLRASALSSSALVRALFPAFPRSDFFFTVGLILFLLLLLCASRTSRSLVSIYTCSTGPPKVPFFSPHKLLVD